VPTTVTQAGGNINEVARVSTRQLWVVVAGFRQSDQGGLIEWTKHTTFAE
jgi:hypothetical protein